VENPFLDRKRTPGTVPGTACVSETSPDAESAQIAADEFTRREKMERAVRPFGKLKPAKEIAP